MQAGGIGYGKADQSLKRRPKMVIKLSFLVVKTIELEWVELPFHLQIQEHLRQELS